MRGGRRRRPRRGRIRGLRPAVGALQEGYGWRNKTRTVEVPYDDWTLDGEPLRDFIRTASPAEMAAPASEVTLLSERWVPSAPVRVLERLLLGAPADFDDGRIALYVCQCMASRPSRPKSWWARSSGGTSLAGGLRTKRPRLRASAVLALRTRRLSLRAERRVGKVAVTRSVSAYVPLRGAQRGTDRARNGAAGRPT